MMNLAYASHNACTGRPCSLKLGALISFLAKILNTLV